MSRPTSPAKATCAAIRRSSTSVHTTPGSASSEGNHTASSRTRPSAEREMSGPDATITGIRPSSFHRIEPSPSSQRSDPVTGNPMSRVRARQMNPWILNDRIFKMNRRMSGGEAGKGDWYQKWYGRYHCREWAREHAGAAPARVELDKVSYRIPGPEEVARRGYYESQTQLARAGSEQRLHTTDCAREPEAQLSDDSRARLGLPPLPAGVYKPWNKDRLTRWQRRAAPTRTPKEH